MNFIIVQNNSKKLSDKEIRKVVKESLRYLISQSLILTALDNLTKISISKKIALHKNFEEAGQHRHSVSHSVSNRRINNTKMLSSHSIPLRRTVKATITTFDPHTTVLRDNTTSLNMRK
ncbi:hypothetical protein G9A89_015724 [Geosiphon pyriformis]|nr:hypothetical protein G9A89_015724 [Geosiphon pyriformis]